MDISLFDYDLPEELIAQYPIRSRDESRLLVLDRSTGKMETGVFGDILNYIRAGDALVVNNTKVFKARLIGNRGTGAEVEIFLVRPFEDNRLRWRALGRPSRRLRAGEQIYFHRQCHAERLSLTLVEKLDDGKWGVEFSSVLAMERIIERYGHVPLPQYIRREDEPGDVERYQTVFARGDRLGAVAAPTAGFHFTPELVHVVRERGVEVCELTLHVGPGTFKPVQVEEIEKHRVDPEFAEIPESVADRLNRVRSSGGRVFAVGTTSVRTLESSPIVAGEIQPFSRDVDLYVRPGHQFRVVDHLITNFHLPKSSLLILVCAFAGREVVLAAYEKAIKEGFRFYSYGDAMLML